MRDSRWGEGAASPVQPGRRRRVVRVHRGVGAAIANAIYHATDVRVRDLPITVERLL